MSYRRWLLKNNTIFFNGCSCAFEVLWVVNLWAHPDEVAIDYGASICLSLHGFDSLHQARNGPAQGTAHI